MAYSKSKMHRSVDQAYDSWSEKHGGNYHDPDDAEAAFAQTSPKIRGEKMTGTRTNREGRLKLYAKHKAGKKHYNSKMKALEHAKNK